MEYKVISQNDTQGLVALTKDGWMEVMRFQNQYGAYIILQKQTAP